LGVLLSLLAAVGYGASDFFAGVAGRRGPARAVALLVQPVGLFAALVGLLVIPWSAPTTSSLAWGALSGIGGAFGVLALYRGLAVGRMTVVAPVAGIMTAVIPAIVGLALGNRPGVVAIAGIVLAVPAVALISRHPERSPGGKSGLAEALVAGVCFALLFIALDRAGTRSGTWPLVSGQSVATLLVAAIAFRTRSAWPVPRGLAPWAIGAGGVGGIGNILFLSATGRGDLATVAVVTSLYPGITVLLARVGLGERLTPLQTLGLIVAALSVVLIAL
jgi:drug/metabolite transporter (DMT)-like permease